MPILDVTHRPRLLGRLRAGDFDDSPDRLDTWRLTSPHRDLLDAAAVAYGGRVEAFDRRDTDDRWQLTTTTATLPVLVPAQNIADGQWYELWSRAGLARRCDGVTLHAGAELGDPDTGACLCDPEHRECRPVTHLVVVLPDLPDVGVWRLTTRSMYAAAELPAQVALLAGVSAGPFAPALLTLEARTSGKGRNVHHFNVPVLRTASTLTALLAGDTLTRALELDPPTLEVSVETPGGPPQPTIAPVSDGTHLEAAGLPPGPPPPRLEALTGLVDLLAARHPRDMATTGELAEFIVSAFGFAADAGIWPETATVRPIDEWAARHLRPSRDPNSLDFVADGFTARAAVAGADALRAMAGRVWLGLRAELDRRQTARSP